MKGRLFKYSLFFLITILIVSCGGNGGGDGGVVIVCGDSEAVYVRMDANDSNPGTISAPLKTIQAATSCAATGQQIRIANGTYESNSNTGAIIYLDDGKSIYGGYSSDFQVRDPVTYPTSINDVTDMTMLIDTDTQYALCPTCVGICSVCVSSRATQATVIDGLIINDATIGFGHTAAILVEGEPTISNNIINGAGVGGIGEFTVGIMAGELGGTVIKNNNITAEYIGIYDYGMLASGFDAPLTISNNTIYSSTGIQIMSPSSFEDKINNNSITGYGGISLTNFSIAIIEANTISAGTGISTTKGAPTIRNNTIKGGAPGIYNRVGSIISNNTIVGEGFAWPAIINEHPSAIIQNNIIDMHDTAGAICIAEAGSNSDPAFLRNNDLAGCSTLYCDEGWTNVGMGEDCVNPITNISDVNALVDTGASGNISIAPSLDSALDYRLTAASPVEVTQGGLDLSADFNTDKAGNTRTVPWSMGAYEFD